jgi:mono/diheme cytochrome c family protein
VTDEEIASLAAWIDAQPALPRAIEPLAATPGRAAFEKAGCADCHAGAKLTSGGSFDVGTGGKFQVPSLLGLRARAPYLHDGCATTIEERFDDACGGTSHGHPSELSAAELADLVSYLSRL